MGVFIYTNKLIDRLKIYKVLHSRGHKEISEFKGDDYSLIYSEKILTPNQNFLSGKELGGDVGDFIIGVGVFFYEGKTGPDALREIYSDLDVVLKNNPIYGHYAFCIHKNGATYVFNDMSGMMRLYICQEKESITVSTSLLSVISTIDNPTFDKVRLATCLANKNIPFIKGIEFLNFYKYLKISGKYISWEEKKIPSVRRIETHEEAVVYTRNLLEDQVKQLKCIGDECINIELTGGLDSRLTASVLKTAGFNYDFVHFPGHNRRDYEIAKDIAEGLNKKLVIQEDREDVSVDQFEKIFGEFDFCFNFFYHHANARRIMNNRYQFTGGYGEDIDTPQIYTTESRIVKDLVYNAVVIPSRNQMKPKIRKQVVDYLTSLYHDYGYRANQELTEKEFADFTALMDASLGNDSRTISAYNAVAIRYGMFSEWHFRHYIMDISFEAKQNRRLTLSLIAAIDPELGSYPFSSHMLTRGKSVNEAAKQPFHYENRANLKNRLPDFVLNWYKKKYGGADLFLLSEIDFTLYKDILNVNVIRRYPAVYRDTLQRLYSIEVLRKVMGITM